MCLNLHIQIQPTVVVMSIILVIPSTPLELSLHEGATLTAVEVHEGEEKSEIWAALDSRDRKSYCSLLSG